MKNLHIKLCKEIEKKCKTNAETHHTIAKTNKRMQFWFQVFPAIITVILGAISMQIFPVCQELTQIAPFLTVLSALVVAVASILNPLKEYYDHLNAAKHFTALKMEAFSLHSAKYSAMSEKEFATSVDNLSKTYQQLILFIPETNNKAFKKAKDRIKRGVHS